MKTLNILLFLAFLPWCIDAAVAGENCESHITGMTCFESGETARASEVNANFKALLDEINALKQALQARNAPDYDSGWIQVTRGQVVTMAHGLNAAPVNVTVYVSDNSFGDPAHLAGYAWYYSGYDVRRGTIVSDITASTYKLRTGGDAIYDTYSATGDLAVRSYTRLACCPGL